MFRPPKNSNQSSPKKGGLTVFKNQGLCKFPYRTCVLPNLESYDFCLKHILEDKSAPYKPCPYVYTVSGKKCGKAALRLDRKDTWFCGEHSRKANLLRQKASTRHAPPQTQESLLASLAHYTTTKEQPGVLKKEENENEETTAKVPSKVVNPFLDLDAAQVNARCSQVLDYASDSESDVEPAMLDSVWRAQDHESSDAESVDSQAEDPLKYSGVYTAEEVTVVVKDKMIRLQSLYIDQFRRLQHLLKERRRKYLHTLKKEKETLCTIHEQEKATVKEQKLYQKLKALNHYHKYFGEEAILHKKALERRAQATENHIVRTSHKGKCAFTEGGVKCGAKTLPVTKYCRKHILEDTQQVLFRACGFKRDDHVCQEPTVNVFENATCVYHINLPSQPHNNLEMAGETKEIKVEEAHVKDMHEDEVIAKTVLDLVASGIQVEDNVIKPNEPDVYGVTKPENSEMTKTDLPNSKEHLINTENELPIHEVLQETSTVSQQPLQEQTPPTSSEEKAGTTITSEPVMQESNLISGIAASTSSEEKAGTTITSEPIMQESNFMSGITENLESKKCDESSIFANQIVVEKMDIDSEIITSSVESPKNEIMEEDNLVMVDMSDVGVVEEVLESDVRTDTETASCAAPVESMQVAPVSGSSVEKG